MKKILLMIVAMLLTSSLAMAQLSPGAEGIRQQVAEYARNNGIKVEYQGDALILNSDTLGYAMLFGGINPVYVELRLGDLDISACNYESISKAVNYINNTRSAVKASILPNRTFMRLSVETFVNDAQSVINVLKKNMSLLASAWKICRQKYDEFTLNRDFNYQDLPFVIYSVNIANTDKNDQIITEVYEDIPSKETQYIHTALSIIPRVEGTYEIGIKFITPDGKVSTADPTFQSPYTFTSTLQINNQQLDYATGGWGSENPGTWPAGNYQIEIYYKDRLIYVKQFTIH